MDKKTKELLKVLEGQGDLIKSILDKDASSTPNAMPLHGNGGLWAISGLDREVINAKIEPFGIGSILPYIPSSDTTPVFGAVLGIVSHGQARITNPCADAPTGYVKGGTLTAKFGLTRFDTNTIDLMEVALRKNRGDFKDLILKGGLIGDGSMTPQSIRSMSDREFFSNVVAAEMMIAGVNAQRELSEDMWQGTVAEGAFPGLDSQITTGHVDVETGATMPALDSKLYNFNYNAVDGSSPDIVEIMAAMEHYLYFNAQHMGFLPVKWAIVMRPELWEEVTKVWVCKYFTNGCGEDSVGGSIVHVNDGAAAELRDRIRSAHVITINGRQYPVIEDTGVHQYDWDNDSDNLDEGEFASSISFVPLSVQGGGFKTTYMEYLDYSAAENMLGMIKAGRMFWTDGGMYSWSIEDEKGWCAKLGLRSQQRVILRTPQLAGKIQKVKYSPIMPTRSPYPGDKYFADGGVSMRAKDTQNSVWL